MEAILTVPDTVCNILKELVKNGILKGDDRLKLLEHIENCETCEREINGSGGSLLLSLYKEFIQRSV